MLAIAIVGVASKRPRVHEALALTMLAAALMIGLSIFLSPDAIREASVQSAQ
jgi:hypothetical protein